eukprot:3090934-Rhodomonas_salina.3
MPPSLPCASRYLGCSRPRRRLQTASERELHLPPSLSSLPPSLPPSLPSSHLCIIAALLLVLPQLARASARVPLPSLRLLTRGLIRHMHNAAAQGCHRHNLWAGRGQMDRLAEVLSDEFRSTPLCAYALARRCPGLTSGVWCQLHVRLHGPAQPPAPRP